MALTLEAALVLPLSLSLVFSIVPPAARLYRQTIREAGHLKQAVRLASDPASLYALAPLAGSASASSGVSARAADGDQRSDVLMTSPKLMFCLVTAVIDDFKILGLSEP